MDESQVIKESLRDELNQFDIYLWKSLENNNSRISEILRHAFKVDGKRIRPMLVFLVAKCCGEITPATYHGAVTVELLHMATLMHDDVVDEASTRRGQPSSNAVFDNKRSVLAGDYVLSSALRESVKTNNLEIIGIISELGQNLAEGELNQYSLVNEIIIDEEEYFKVIDKKTASLLYACAKIGAITAGADRVTIDEFGKAGRILGIAFQIRDDIFDYYKADVGKPTGNDIREGKITLPLIYALNHAPQALSDEMMKIIRSCDFSPVNIELLLEFAKSNGGIEYAQKTIDNLLEEAEQIIENVSIDNEFKITLNLLVMYLKNRMV
ncbi:MAG TPA: polyprenyl synthetase [Porphyromonadaceae bacterium]|jgi:octaprenyl-diphosphate synthase|uniref:polyprenyl synthetase family protein n=1 Tax=Petrimonas sulfuriphila TaxID=285070 RepID=UPI000E8CDADA|nr:polyprenyl synthetase family protein [Petrimonas sp.]MDD4845561.1 polyprenyl synthetase family protein [Petrimonas sp.]HBF95441.1 polyprenyl synthetase [Porphyromonadaceae bacterium]HCB90022.1 polyprenyl synthetase [Porphyromonadaceae bacterium]